MQKARMLGNYVEYLAKQHGVSSKEICDVLGCSQIDWLSFLKGRRLVSFDQLTAISAILKIPAAQLMNGNTDHYEESVVHCMNQFSDTRNREQILDLIDDYLDVLDALSSVAGADPL